MFFSIGYLNLNATELNIPDSYEILDSVSGDLDNDLVPELVIVYNNLIDYKEGENIPRELWIYKKNKDKWELWKKSLSAIYGSLSGGIMGDPYFGIKINEGILITRLYGGSNWKWGHDDYYKFHNGDIYLVRYEGFSGHMCEYWLYKDFNLLNGKFEVKKEYLNCEAINDEDQVYKIESEEFYKKGIAITLENRNTEKIHFKSPKYNYDLYISIKY